MSTRVAEWTGPPEPGEAAPYYFRYIDRVLGGDILGVLEKQREEALSFLGGISEELSLRSYASGKWSIRQVWSHVNDTELVFLSRAFWFARGFDSPLPSYDQDVAAAAAGAGDVAWSDHIDQFEGTRRATLAFFRNLPAEAWTRGGIASGNPFSVRALAYIIAGHADHHRAVLQERYLP